MPKRKNTTARYAFIGLILALVGCIATGFLAVILGAVAIGIYLPAKPESIPVWLSISASAIIVGLALYGLLNPTGVRRFFTGRQARYGSNALIMSLAFVGILILVNVLVNTLASQNPNLRWDTTQDKQNTLAPETIQALATLPDKVTAIAFYSSQTPTDTAKQLLANFKSNSKGKFDFRFVDPNADPVLANQYGVTGDAKIVLTMGKSAETAAFADETELDRALIRLISPQQRTVYFLTGHGEPDINGADSSALSRARQTLESKNYTVKSLNLASEHKIPEDAKAIVVAGPKSPLLDQEVALLRSYANNGGSLVVMEDPVPFTDIGTQTDPLADYLKSDWGISLDNDVIVDTFSSNFFQAIAAAYDRTHPITQHISTYTIMPQARSLTLSQAAPKGVTLTGLMFTAPPSQQSVSWGETDFSSLQGTNSPSFDQAADIVGPLTLAASGENSNTHGRIVVFGNSIFATDKGFDAYANGDIFINSMDWAAQEENLLQITPHQPISRTFNPPPQLQFIMILLTSVIVIPGLVVVFGISTWVARRRKG